MWTLTFWKATAERAIKSFCQGLALALGADAAGLVHADWWAALSAAAGLAALSVLTSIGSGLVPVDGPPGASPSLVNTTPPLPRRFRDRSQQPPGDGSVSR